MAILSDGTINDWLTWDIYSSAWESRDMITGLNDLMHF